MNDKKQSANMGVAVGLALWGLCFLELPKQVAMAPLLAWLFSGLGFLLLLIGIMGACIEVDRMYKR